MFGWTGQRLKVYLNDGRITREEIPEHLRIDFLGGRGLNAKTLFDELKPGVDPLGPENIFIVGVGPIVGTLVPGSCRYTVTAKSPQTFAHGDANGGGDFGAELKFAGIDQIVFYGKSPRPAYLWIKDGKTELRDASHLWGKGVWETHHLLTKELDEPGLSEISIGPGGENKVRFACVLANLSRAAGRSGMGAVMGSKNLKAVVVRGTGSVKIAQPDNFYEAVKNAKNKVVSHPFFASYRQTGSLILTYTSNILGKLGTNNLQETWYDKEPNIGPKFFEDNYAVRHRGCFACPTHCSHLYRVKDGPYATHGEGIEFGATGNYGSRCGNDNLASILYMGTLSDQLGVDQISCAAVIAFAMEAWQRGIITARDTDGLDLSWGNTDTMIKLINKIAYREGFGDLLAEGTEIAARKIKGSERFALTIKGLDVIEYDPRVHKGDALAYATSTRGADHLRGFTPFMLGYYYGNVKELEKLFGDRLGIENARKLANLRGYEGWGGLIAMSQDQFAAANAVEICTRMCFANFGLNMDDVAKLFSTTTGMEISGRELERIGERIYNVERAFNMREGLRRKDDTLPPRWFLDKVPAGPAEGEIVVPDKFQEMLDEYYAFRGWDKDGFPTAEKLGSLNLNNVAEQLSRLPR